MKDELDNTLDTYSEKRENRIDSFYEDPERYIEEHGIYHSLSGDDLWEAKQMLEAYGLTGEDGLFDDDVLEDISATVLAARARAGFSASQLFKIMPGQAVSGMQWVEREIYEAASILGTQEPDELREMYPLREQ